MVASSSLKINEIAIIHLILSLSYIQSMHYTLQVYMIYVHTFHRAHMIYYMKYIVYVFYKKYVASSWLLVKSLLVVRCRCTCTSSQQQQLHSSYFYLFTSGTFMLVLGHIYLVATPLEPIIQQSYSMILALQFLILQQLLAFPYSI